MDFRLTNIAIYEHLIRNIQANREEMNNLQEALYTGKKINRPSDDPRLYHSISNIKTQISELKQYIKNCEYGEDWLNFSYATVENSYDILSEVKDIAYQASNDTSTAELREMSAQMVGDLHDQLVDLVNTELNGRYIFGGSNGHIPPVAYINDSGEEVPYQSPDGHWREWENNGVFEISIGKNNTINLATSAGVFLEITETESAFDILADLKNCLETGDGDGIRQSLSKIDQAIDTITGEQSNIGSKMERLAYTKDFIGGLELSLNISQSAKEDADVIETSVELSANEATYQTILQATTKTLNMSLFDLLS